MFPLSLRSPTAWQHSVRHPYVSGALLGVLAVAEAVHGQVTSVTVLVTLALAVLPLLARRREPRVGFVVLGASLLNFLFRPELLLTAAVAGAMGLYTLARHRAIHPLLTIALGVSGSLLVNIGHVMRGAYDLGGRAPVLGGDGSLSYFTESFVLAVAMIATVCVADAVRAREESRLAREAAQRKLIAMEREHAAAAERASIARELHDIVAHSVSVIAVQAESATYTTPDLSPAARDGFQQIAGSARSAMSELRQLLSVLHTDATERASVAPQPTLDSLDALLAAHRSGGGQVELHTEGIRPDLLPPSLELTVYRIAQEALTNTRRHAPGAKAQVDISYAPGRVRLNIRDDGPGPQDPDAARSGGHGLDGMVERAKLIGGQLTHGGAGPEGGFQVRADLPIATYEENPVRSTGR
ncbi:two-component sensor histidine kinase [Streptomyces spiroverticillatus]|uniref:histidine kinase n=1 Tax=Streptomyces finlayi TaxID=67296 RepID=A0A918WZS3_9ACTN|nr:histidine kinase [Streptomyces finlayi]GHA12734.1 two-component sensor histidine kinase [Streptomyces spiroverticillatus]GHC98401.1 two-component sensor histidine kinase [Streptomyces finlayi]